MAAERAGRREPGRQKLDRQNADRGKLQLFLGVAPGAGKTYAMLAEGRRRAALGEDVVIGLADTHRRRTPRPWPVAWRWCRCGGCLTGGRRSMTWT